MGRENSGRRPQPTALKLLRGNPSKTAVNRLEPRTPPGEVVKPETLSVGAVAVWDEMAPICMEMGTLTSADVRAFAGFCELQALMTRTCLLKRGHHGEKIVKYANALRPYYAMFGMEPASRSRIQVPQSEAPRSKVANLK